MTRFKIIFFSIFISILLFGTARPADAFSFGDVVKGVKGFFSDVTEKVSHLFVGGDGKSKNVSLSSSIELASDGDLDANGEIDSGDVVVFRYMVSNSTENEYPFVTLLTNIPRQNLNFIHEIQGTASLNDKDGTVVIPNLRLIPSGELIVSFKARVNYSPEEIEVFTEPELISQDKVQLAKTPKQLIKAKPWKDKEMPSVIQAKDK